MFLFQVLGVIILLCYILILKVKSISDWVPFLKNCLIEGKMKIITPILSFIFILLPGIIFYAEYGTNYYLVSPLGNEFAVMDSRGFKLRLFSRVSPWTKYIDIKTVDTDSIGVILEDTKNPKFKWDFLYPLLWGNGTFHPILNYSVKGILFYQGC